MPDELADARKDAYYAAIPPPIRRALDGHAESGRECGSFVTAVLRNDLSDAVMWADADSFAAFRLIMQYVYNELPGPCWGSAEKVAAWRARFASGPSG